MTCGSLASGECDDQGVNSGFTSHQHMYTLKIIGQLAARQAYAHLTSKNTCRPFVLIRQPDSSLQIILRISRYEHVRPNLADPGF
jgi:hypothetical protein